MIIRIMLSLFGIRICYRLGRKLYMQARGDCINNMATNGELMLQSRVIKAVKELDIGPLTCFDVGGFIGDWSDSFLQNCGSLPSQLYIFEPVPATAIILKQRLGEGQNIHYENYAMSSTNGTDMIFIANSLSGANSLHNESSDQQSIQINKITAEQFCKDKNIESVHLFKCDTEGHDFAVIYGALPLLKESRISVLQFEYNHRWIFSRHYLKDVFDLIKDIPYRLGKVGQNGITLYSEWHYEHERFFEANYVLLHKDTLSWFNVVESCIDEYNTMMLG